jgi:hypothetical protein
VILTVDIGAEDAAMNPMHEVTRTLTFDGHAIGARRRQDGDGNPMDRDAGWVAFWPANEPHWLLEVARPSGERNVYIRFRVGGVAQTWPLSAAVRLLDDGWMMVPSEWDRATTDLRPIAEEVLALLESDSPDQVGQVRTALRAATGEENGA